MVTAAEQPIRIGRDIRDDVCRRPLELSDHEVGGEARGRAEPLLLPGAEERPGRTGVGDRSPRRCERKPAARALATALDLPRRGRAAASTPRGDEWPEQRAAVGAQRLGRSATGDAAPGQEKDEEPRGPRYGGRCDVSVPTSRKKCYAGE
jgi:hypothetical protein